MKYIEQCEDIFVEDYVHWDSEWLAIPEKVKLCQIFRLRNEIIMLLEFRHEYMNVCFVYGYLQNLVFLTVLGSH